LLAAGYQQALNSNENNFKWADWKDLGDIEITARDYPVSNRILRGKDIMLRVERNFRYARFNYFTGLLGIYRLTKDEIFVAATKQRAKVAGTDQLALTYINGIGYRITARSSLKFLLGLVIVRRDLNPDGLSREGVASLSYQFRF
jgi:hypothetical protein